MRILVTGGKGMLGRTLSEELASHECIVADLPECDITDADALLRYAENSKAEAIIHAAAMTNVDACESESEAAYRINGEGSRNVAIVASKLDIRLIAISTDYVFSGAKDGPREWSEEDIPRPRTVYGASKFVGEEMIKANCPDAVILRIAWLYGKGGPSFVHTMANLFRSEGPDVRVVDDQYGNPTSARAVAGAVAFLLERPFVSGIVHATCEGIATWHEFAGEIRRALRSPKRGLVACTTDQFPRPAPRPFNSALAKNVLGLLGYGMPHWREEILDFMKTEFPEEMLCASGE